MATPKKGKITDAHTWRDFFKGSHLSYYDLTGDTVVTIKEMKYETITGPGGRKDDCLVMVFTDKEMLPMIVNTTNAKTITDVHKTNVVVEWVGKSIVLYPDDNVKMKGETVGGIRVRNFAPKVELKTLNDGRFDKMLAAIEQGAFDYEKARNGFALSPDQISKLEALKAKMNKA